MSVCQRQCLQFYVGLLLGLSTTVIVHLFSWSTSPIHWVGSLDFITDSRLRNETGNLNFTMDLKCSSFEDEEAIAKQMFHRVKIACLILNSHQNLQVKTIHVKNSWTKRCNLVLFMSSAKDDSFPTIWLNVTEGYDQLTAKTMYAFKYMYDRHLNDADWFLKADDDTYVIMENLRYFLSSNDPKLPVYFGQRYKPFVAQGYASGGAGYVISREALSRFGRSGFGNKELCAGDGGYEDVEFGRCLENLSVQLKPSQDVLNRTRFHGATLQDHVHSQLTKDFMENYDFEGGRSGIGNISKYAISFHYVKPKQMLELEFLLYHVRPFGILNLPMEINVT